MCLVSRHSVSKRFLCFGGIVLYQRSNVSQDFLHIVGKLLHVCFDFVHFIYDCLLDFSWLFSDSASAAACVIEVRKLYQNNYKSKKAGQNLLLE